nr:hypothetical protein [Pelagibius marinus]
MTHVLAHIADHKINRLDELLALALRCNRSVAGPSSP